MASPLTLFCSNRHSSTPSLSIPGKISPRHFNKQLVCKVRFSSSSRVQLSTGTRLTSPSTKFNGTRLLQPVRCAISSDPLSENTVISAIKGFFESISSAFSQLTPIDVCKWCGVFAVAIAVSKRTVNLVLNPFFWVYFSWSWLFWPWYVALGVGAYGIHCFRKFLNGDATVTEQFALATSIFTWITVVPPAFFNGYVEGWPFVFFFVYHYFVFFNATVRKRFYGDTCLRPHDPKWDISVPKWKSVLFCVGVAIGHWLAAFEGPELIRVPGGWSNAVIWGLIMMTIFMQYHATLYLAKYSEKVVVPSVVVIFGPYRWVRHPIYASTMLLFLSYFAALRAPISAVYIAAVCVLYYNQKAVLEEELLIEEFGESYVEYQKKVPYKFIPFVY